MDSTRGADEEDRHMSWVIEKLRNLALTAVGVIAMIGWWTFTGGDGAPGGAEVGPLPAVVDGGGHAIDVSLHTSEPIYFSASFSCPESDEEWLEVDGREELAPGDHELSFDVAGECDYAILEAGMEQPPVGAELSWRVEVDGRRWQEERMVLDQPLAPNRAFFLQTGWEDGSLEEMLEYLGDA
jgi:hypothetical protein